MRGLESLVKIPLQCDPATLTLLPVQGLHVVIDYSRLGSVRAPFIPGDSSCTRETKVHPLHSSSIFRSSLQAINSLCSPLTLHLLPLTDVRYTLPLSEGLSPPRPNLSLCQSVTPAPLASPPRHFHLIHERGNE